MIEQLIGRAFATRNAAHLAHFKTKSYAAHMALDGFYTDLVGAVDDLVECWIGRNGMIDDVPAVATPSGEIKAHLVAEAEWITKNRKGIAEGSDVIGNLVDEISAIYLKAIYKLENLS